MASTSDQTQVSGDRLDGVLEDVSRIHRSLTSSLGGGRSSGAIVVSPAPLACREGSAAGGCPPWTGR